MMFSDGSISHRLYTKPASKRITLHHNSHHPDSVKRAVVDNEIRRATQNSSAEHVTDSIRATINKLTINNYPADMIQQAIQKPHRIRTRDKRPRTDQPLALRLPFISNRLDTEIG